LGCVGCNGSVGPDDNHAERTVTDARKVTIPVGDTRQVSGLLRLPPKARACYVLAHGAGAGMTHPSLEAVSAELAERGIATLRFLFPYMEAGGKRPDPPALAQATVRAAVAEAAQLVPKLPLVAGGRSFGGRMTSQAQAAAPLDGVEGLAFLAFPLHAAGRPSSDRAAHLSDVKVPMLFLQGTRDALAELDHLRPVIKGLGKRAMLKLYDDADHSFHVPARTGRKDADVRREMLDDLAAWIDKVV
jgi:predicted alpha/beta-hydrolase family hydrolase